MLLSLIRLQETVSKETKNDDNRGRGLNSEVLVSVRKKRANPPPPLFG